MGHGKIQILTVPHGAAHERLGLTLKKAIRQIRPDVEVETNNALDHCSLWFRAYYNSYEIPLKYWPALWGWVEGYQHTHKATGPGWLYQQAIKSLARWLAACRPDAVVTTEVGLCELAALIKRSGLLDFRLIAVPTGIDTDHPWVQPEVDLYVVDPHEVAPFLNVQGVPQPKVLACGVPVDPQHESLPTKAEARKKLGLLPEVPVLLILFGGSGIGKISRIVPSVERTRDRVQTVWITGRNVSLKERLEKRLPANKDSRVLGWTENMHDWMAASDLLIGKPGSGTVLEAINSGLPILAFDPLPGIEHRTSILIEQRGIGCWVRRKEQLSQIIDNLLSHPETLQRFRVNALSMARPGAAWHAAQAILDKINSDPKGELTSTCSAP